jgi:hypothetical protein
MEKDTRCFITTILNRKMNWMEHLLRGDGLLKDMLKVRILRNRPWGRRKKGMINELMEGSSEK